LVLGAAGDIRGRSGDGGDVREDSGDEAGVAGVGEAEGIEAVSEVRIAGSDNVQFTLVIVYPSCSRPGKIPSNVAMPPATIV
jgi:hypothetical protein